MRIELTEFEWLDAGQELTLPALVQISGLQETELHELVDCGVITPMDTGAMSLSFPADQVVLARAACRLRNDFDLDTPGLIVALTLIERVRDLEQRLQQLDAQRPRPLL